VEGCEILLVIGTSAQVYPAAGLPLAVKQWGGKVFEFNLEQELGRDHFSGASLITDYFFEGDAERTLPMLLKAMEEHR
jgi:NAD-dependent SIR2 family protein deacetylase